MIAAGHCTAARRPTPPPGQASAARLPVGLLSALLVFLLLAPAAGLQVAAACELAPIAHCERDVEVAAGRPGDEAARKPRAERCSATSFVSGAVAPRWRRIAEGGLPPLRAP
jgi:hypothetical protein